MRCIWVLLIVLAVVGAAADQASANTVQSSTMLFVGDLTDLGGGAFAGVMAMIDEAAMGAGDGISGFDVYARNGVEAMWDAAGGGSSNYQHGIVSDHDAYNAPGGWGTTYDPDVGDWYNYQLRLTATSWYLEYNGGIGNITSPTAADFSAASATPMSGAMDWSGMFASEDDAGAYYSGMGTAESPGYATNNPWVAGGAGHWDMDWSWGSESIPLQMSGFSVNVTRVGDKIYAVSLTPSPEPGTLALLGLGLLGLGAIVRRRRRA